MEQTLSARPRWWEELAAWKAQQGQRWGGGKQPGLPFPSLGVSSSRLRTQTQVLLAQPRSLEGPSGHGHQLWHMDMVVFVMLASEISASPLKEEVPGRAGPVEECWPPLPMSMLLVRQFFLPKTPCLLLSRPTPTHPSKPSSNFPASGMPGFLRQMTVFPLPVQLLT